jgi:Zn-dependent protease with chaperone function
MTKRFTAIIIIANIILGLLLYLSSQLVLSEINGAALSGYSITSFNITPTQIAGQVTIPIAFAPMPNFIFYVFALFLIVNACFIIKLLLSKETKQNPS